MCGRYDRTVWRITTDGMAHIIETSAGLFKDNALEDSNGNVYFLNEDGSFRSLQIVRIGTDGSRRAFDNGVTGLTGGSGALKVWAHFMSRASKQPLAYRMPDDIQTQWIDDHSGYLTGEGCPNSRMLPFITGSEPRQRTDCAPRDSGSGVQDWFESLFGGNG